jgi:ubiquinone/menaquinone biosynthesis C-methylase UbiE
VLDEVRRVLKPGGTYVFYEHVAAPSGSLSRRVQQLVKRPHRWLLNGCEVDRDTQLSIEAAAFTELDLRRADAPWTVAAWTWPRIIGHAVR